MSPDEQRIAIAEACGWKVHENNRALISPIGKRIEAWPLHNLIWHLPDYLNDLNAIHSAEAVLSVEHKAKFADILFELTLASSGASEEDGWFIHVHATAAQRAEAFLRTISKWTE